MTMAHGAWVVVLRNILAGAVLLLALLFLFQSSQHRALQDRVNGQRTQLQNSQTMANVNSSLIQLLAKQAAATNDKALTDLLARNGVTFQQNNIVAEPAP